MTPYETRTKKERFKEETAKLKNMTWKDKLWYIWEYYKFPIIGVALAIFLVTSIGTAMYNNRFDTALSCVILNSKVTSDDPPVNNYFNEGFRQFINLDENTKIDVDYSMSISFDESAMTEYSYAEMAKLTAIISSKELDIMIASPETIDHYGTMGGFMDIKETLPPDLYEKVKDSLYVTASDETGEETACGIRLSETDFQAKTGLIVKDPVIAILGNSTHIENSIQLIRYILQ